ncbi:MAG: PspA/IM30 family protein, partial [Cyanobacteria bacterium P01_A01_bin.135]
GKISEAKTKKDMLKARASAAKANEQLQNTIGRTSTNSSMAAFERMEEKVQMMEAKSSAAAELAGADLESQFVQLEAGTDVDDELAAMKRQLSGASPEQGQLPAGDTSAAAPATTDEELEKLRREIDQL